MTAYKPIFSDADRESLRGIAQELLRRRMSSIQNNMKDPNWDPYAPPKSPSMFNQVMPTVASAGGAALGSGLVKGGLGLIGLGGETTAAGAGASGVTGGTGATSASVAPSSGASSGAFLSPSIWGSATQGEIAATQAADASAASSALSGGAAGASAVGDGIMGTGIGGSAGVALPAAGIAAGAYTGYQQGKGLIDAAKGKDLDWQQQAALALPTFGASLLYNPIKNMFGGGIHPEQQDRNDYAKAQASKGLTGLDSKAYNIDQSNGKNAEYVGAVNPLAAITTGNDKMRSDAAGMMANDNLSRGLDPLQGAREQFRLSGYDRDSAYNAVLGLKGIDEATRNAYLASIDKTFGVKNPNATS